MTKCTHCDATVLSAAETESKYPSVEAMKAAVELEIHAAIGQVQTIAIGRMIQQAIDAALAAAPASWRSGATPAVGGEARELAAEMIYYTDFHFVGGPKPEWVPDGNSHKQDEARKVAEAILRMGSAQPASPLRGRDADNSITQAVNAATRAIISMCDTSHTWDRKIEYVSARIMRCIALASSPEQPAAGREAIIKECELAARGAVYEEIYSGRYVSHGDSFHNWSRDSEYGRGRHAAADAVRALSDQETT